MNKVYDIFGIETDASIQDRADAEKRKNHQKRLEIIDEDIFRFLHNYRMLDDMACQSTKQAKKDFVTNFLLREVTELRKKHSGYSYVDKYRDKPVDKGTCALMAEYVLNVYAHENGVKYKRKILSSHQFIYVDKNNVNIFEAQSKNAEIIQTYKEKLVQEKYPLDKPENQKYYVCRSGEKPVILTNLLSAEDSKKAVNKARKDRNFIILEEVQ